MRFDGTLITRTQWGAAPSQGVSRDFVPQGVTFHYEGNAGTIDPPDHDSCAGRVRGIQRAHLNHPTEDYNDIAYSFLICMHGVLFEGRGLGVRSGANGTAKANRAFYSVCFLAGTRTPVWPEMAAAGRATIHYLRHHGAGAQVNGHRDHVSTACPGRALANWLQADCPAFPRRNATARQRLEWASGWFHDRPGSGGERGVGDFPGAQYFGPGANNAYVTQLGRMLIQRGAGRFYTVGPGPKWSEADLRATRAFQQAQGWRGEDADGIPGPTTWRLLVTGGGRDI
ncbi:peptidoglycan-binding protein [Streptomyces sp. DSM 44917]|uniref:Peptidoglycan-binding protein n=1 Tax=Streptomyces boetiae TaxID=3075541 RepID=A0ABU2L521_9ACTN|nr:peptidoglycan-binding protein [Streptomyces sp. DSM 44917]MDT0306472.1 peptidoglycan-binding protein [Streptomyces sp. DSM 44917]